MNDDDLQDELQDALNSLDESIQSMINTSQATTYAGTSGKAVLTATQGVLPTICPLCENTYYYPDMICNDCGDWLNASIKKDSHLRNYLKKNKSIR